MEDLTYLSRDELICKCAELYFKLNNRNKSHQEISQPIQLLVEGPDDKYFLLEILNKLGIGNIQVQKIDGKTNLKTFLKTLQLVTGYDRVRSIGIILDADLDVNSTFQSITSILQSLHLPVPERMNLPKTGAIQISVYIMPDCMKNGDLETLLLDAIQDDPTIPCIDSFFTCVQGVKDHFRPTTKSKLYSYLAIQEKPGSRISEAAKSGYINLDSPTFTPLEEFLRSL